MLFRSNVQISSLNGDTIHFEDSLQEAKEALNKSMVNDGLIISDRTAYVQTLINRKNKLITAEENLEIHKAKLAFLKETLASLEAEVSLVEQA